MFNFRLTTPIFTLLFSLALLSPVYAESDSALCGLIDEKELINVGETRVQVMFFKVYDAYLFTNTGVYPSYDHLQLELNYLRSIKSTALVNATADEWHKQGFPNNEQNARWLQQLYELWPDVNAGDCLVAEHRQGKGIAFYNNQGLLGEINSEEFANQFLAIWLSDNSSFKRNRNELVGLD